MRAASDNLTGRASLAVQWRLAGTVVTAGCQLAVGVLLARLLTPADFGVVSLAYVVLRLVHPVGDLGLGGAVIQRAGLSERHVRTAFTFSILLGLALTGATMWAAPLGALVMADPQVTPVLRVLAIGFAVRGTSVVAEALLRRRLDFRRQFFIDAGSYLAGYGGVAVVLALAGYGVWSLVWGALVQTLVASGSQLAVARHSIRPALGRQELGELLHFGLGSAANLWVNCIALNGDNFVVGRWIGAAGLGLYGRAYALMDLPYTFTASVMSGVLFPVLAQVQHDQERLRRGYLLMTQLTALVAAPSMATLAIAAPHLVPSLYGAQWTGVVAPLQVLCLAGYFRALYHLGSVVVQSVGRVYSELWRQAIYAVLVVGGALAGTRYGLPGVAAGVSVAIVYMFIAAGQLALRVTNTGWRVYVRAQLGALVTAALTCGVALPLRLVLESQQVSSPVIAVAVLAGASAPWAAGILWHLGDPDPEVEPLRAALPGWSLRLVDMLRGRR